MEVSFFFKSLAVSFFFSALNFECPCLVICSSDKTVPSFFVPCQLTTSLRSLDLPKTTLYVEIIKLVVLSLSKEKRILTLRWVI